MRKSVDPAIAYRQQSRDSLVRELASSLQKVRFLSLDILSMETLTLRYSRNLSIGPIAKPHKFRPQSEIAAETIAGIYDELERGHEEHLQPSNILDDVFGLGAAQTMEDWIEEHSVCFRRGDPKANSAFPLPPLEHQCPPPPDGDCVM